MAPPPWQYGHARSLAWWYRAALGKDIEPDEAAPVTIVIWHGFTNAPSQFSVAGGPFAGEVVLPAVQRYADGTTAAWDQRSTAGADEPEHPAPTINAAPPVAAAATDHPARWLGGLGLLAGAAGVAIGAAAARGRKSAPNDENRLEEENGHA